MYGCIHRHSIDIYTSYINVYIYIETQHRQTNTELSNIDKYIDIAHIDIAHIDILTVLIVLPSCVARAHLSKCFLFSSDL